jgi:hypothetical protein
LAPVLAEAWLLVLAEIGRAVDNAAAGGVDQDHRDIAAPVGFHGSTYQGDRSLSAHTDLSRSITACASSIRGVWRKSLLPPALSGRRGYVNHLLSAPGNPAVVPSPTQAT